MQVENRAAPKFSRKFEYRTLTRDVNGKRESLIYDIIADLHSN